MICSPAGLFKTKANGLLQVLIYVRCFQNALILSVHFAFNSLHYLKCVMSKAIFLKQHSKNKETTQRKGGTTQSLK